MSVKSGLEGKKIKGGGVGVQGIKVFGDRSLLKEGWAEWSP